MGTGEKKINPILLEIPGELGGERINLRAPRASDGELIFPSVKESLAELKVWMPWATDEYDQARAEEWCRKSAGEFILRNQLQYLIFLRDGGEHIGNVGAFKFEWEIPSCEVGYWLRTSRTGCGYMVDAVQVLTCMLQDTLKMARVQIRADQTNRKSVRVAERAGFELDGVLRNDSPGSAGKLRSTCVFSRVRER